MKNRILVLCLLPVLLLSGCGQKAPAETLPVQEEMTEETASEASLPEQTITMEEPSDSAAPVPGKNSDTIAPTNPKETGKPAGTMKPAQDKTPVETTKPTESKPPTETTAPAEDQTPEETTKPAEEQIPTETTLPAETAHPTTEPTERPAETTEPPTETTKPQEETKPNGGNVSPEWTPPVL